MSAPGEEQGAPAPLAALRGARPAPAVENRIVEGAMARAMGPRARPVWPWLVPVAAAAAAVVVWIGRAGTPLPTLVPTLPGPGETPKAAEVARAEEAPHLRFRTEATDAVMREETVGIHQKIVHLTQGTATFSVDPVPPGGLFAVQTPHGRVEVVGTRFTVAVGEACSRVSVSEGRVRVRRDADVFLVGVGESRDVCRGAPAGEETVRQALADLAAGRSDAAGARLEAYLADQPNGLFAEEALFHLALLARRSGDAEAARAATERFLHRFPTGQRAERLRASAP